MSNVSSKTTKLVQLGVLVAIMAIFAITPIGYLKIGAVEISFMMIPVVIGAIAIGPAAGAILGGVFGITSFIQALGTSAFGMFLIQLDPLFTFVECMIPRILAGWLSGLIFIAVGKIDKTKIISFITASLSGAVLNTVFFMLGILIMFWNNTGFIDQMAEWGLPTESFGIFMAAFVGVNGVVEAIVCFVVGAALAKVLVVFLPKVGKKKATTATEPVKTVESEE